jgi:glycosyltransferase 2 family protein
MSGRDGSMADQDPTLADREGPGRGRGQSAGWRLAQVVLFILIGWGIYRVLSPELGQLSAEDLTRWRPAGLPLAASFALLVAFYIGHAFIWRKIVRDLGIGRPTVAATLRIYFLASLGRYLPGKVWTLAGMAVLAGRAGLAPGPAAAAQVLGQFGFLATGMLFLGLTLPEWTVALGAAGEAGGTGAGTGAGATLPLTVGAAMLVTAGAMIWLLVATPLGHGFRERLAAALGPRAGDRLRGAFALADRVRPLDAALWAVAYAVSWAVLGLAFALFVAAFEPATAGNTRFVAGTVAAAYLVGYLFFIVPAGIGVREGAMVLLLAQVMPHPAGALVVSALSRVWFTAAELVPLALLPVLKDSSDDAGPSGTLGS